MSERILRALIQLFAFVTLPGKEGEARRKIVQSFLSQHLNQQLTSEYLELYDTVYNEHIAKFERSMHPDKRRSAVSVKILKITSEINKDLIKLKKYCI